MWIYEDDNKLLYFISTNFTYCPNIVLMSFAHTLIKDEIKKEKIPMMELYNENILSFLKQINENGSLIIVENVYKISQDALKHSIAKFFKLINNEENRIPFMIIFSLKNNKYKKPYTHLFSKIQTIYTLHNTETNIDLSKSLMIGNNAGRLKTNLYPMDISDYDRAFAMNIGLKNFVTPNQIFTKDLTQRQWRWRMNFNINSLLENQKTMNEIPFSAIFNDRDANTKIIVFITGPPTSGKTLLGVRINRFLTDEVKKNVTVLDINNFENIYQMIEVFLSHDLQDVMIIIDTLESIQKRNLWFSTLAKKLNFTQQNTSSKILIKYIETELDRNACEFLNLFRIQITKTGALEQTYKYIYNNYYNYYKPLSISNIVSEIPKKILLNCLKYIKYPIILRDKKEMHFHY